MKKVLLLALFLTVCTPAVWAGQEDAREHIAAMEAYKKGDFANAISGLEGIIQKGVHNGQLYYNLANAHMKNNDLGKAILWYERALPLLPNDPDLKFNLTYARSLTRDASEDPAVSLVRIFFFWKYKLSPSTVLMLALGSNLLFWCLAAGWRFTGRRYLRRAMLVALVPAAIFVVTASANYYQSTQHRHGIILADTLQVRSGLEPTSTELFELHAGAKVKVLKRLSTHVQIQFSKDKIGWVPENQLGLI